MPEPSDDDKRAWLTAKDIARFLMLHRDNDVKVNINGCDVPIADIEYDRAADVIRIHLYDGFDLLMARESIAGEFGWDPETDPHPSRRPEPGSS